MGLTNVKSGANPGVPAFTARVNAAVASSTSDPAELLATFGWLIGATLGTGLCLSSLRLINIMPVIM